MKTFLLCALSILEDHGEKEKKVEARKIPFVDGLIINREEAGKNWLLEAVVLEENSHFFKEVYKKKELFHIEAIITKPTNAPVTLVCSVLSINPLIDHLTIHVEGVIVDRKEDFSEKILESLLKEGLEKEKLLNEFKKRKKDNSQTVRRIFDNLDPQS